MSHLHPTAELAERALLPDDPGQALALTRVLFGATPRMFNHHRGLWGYSGIALDGAPLTVQSTGIGGPSAAIVVAELHALGLRRAVRIGRAWAVGGALRAGELVAATAVVAADGASRALGAGARIDPDPALTAALRGDRAGVLASADVRQADPAWDAVAFDLESAAVLAAAARAGIAAACLVAIEGPVELEDVAERLGRAALPGLRRARLLRAHDRHLRGADRHHRRRAERYSLRPGASVVVHVALTARELARVQRARQAVVLTSSEHARRGAEP